MKYLIVISLTVLQSCSSPTCETPCGLSSATTLCEELQQQETRVLVSFSESVDHWSISWTCDRIVGFSVEVDPSSGGDDFVTNGQVVLGYTDCAHRKIVTANEDWAKNAFTHELGHVIEGCLGPPIVPVWHYGWEGRRINAAVNNATLGAP